MCGIAGFVCKKNQKPPSKLLARMVKAIRHRGSDDEGVYIKDNAALGHRRLSILDLSASGHQPMPDTSGKIWITFNGEIYNYLELKKELSGPWQSSSDTEVLLKGYKKWGKRTPEHLNGIFAFALWDEHKKELYAARDHLGVKPFYYAIQNGVFYFASEIKALLVAGIKTKPNDKIIYDYLAYGYYHHTNETFFENIHQLPAGCFLLYKNGKLKIERYWDLKDRVLDLSNWSGGKAAGDFFHVFKDAVCIQLRSDVPIGVQLSGGFDSSAVTAMVHHIVGGQKNFRLFSHVYSDHKDKEIPFMKALAKGLGWKWEYITVSPSDMSDLAEEVLWHQDEPFPGLPTFGLHMLAKVCRENKIPVILGGQGGDEVGAGYEYYMGAYFLDVLQNDGLDRMYDELNAYGMLRSISDEHAVLRFFINSLSSYFLGGTSADASSFANAEVLSRNFIKQSHHERPDFEKPFESALQNMQYRDILYTKLPRILHSADRAAMAYGIEQRVPFVDYRLMELGISLAGRHKIHSGQQRYFMRQALKKIMPEYVLNAPKRAVPSPQRQWFKRELRPWITSILSSKSFANRHYFDQKKILAEYKAYTEAPIISHTNSFHIWQWIHLELWLRKYFD